jgi:hypothetical protein
MRITSSNGSFFLDKYECELVVDCETESIIFGTNSTQRLHTARSTLAYKH